MEQNDRKAYFRLIGDTKNVLAITIRLSDAKDDKRTFVVANNAALCVSELRRPSALCSVGSVVEDPRSAIREAIERNKGVPILIERLAVDKAFWMIIGFASFTGLGYCSFVLSATPDLLANEEALKRVFVAFEDYCYTGEPVNAKKDQG